VATALLPRFWTLKEKSGAEATDAFAQGAAWGSDEERIWAHPPLEQIEALIDLIDDAKRKAEVIVVVPHRPSAPWYYRLASLSDDKLKCRAGKLIKLDAAAPSRLEEWPIMCFLVRREKPKGKSSKKGKAPAGAPAASRPPFTTSSVPNPVPAKPGADAAAAANAAADAERLAPAAAADQAPPPNAGGEGGQQDTPSAAVEGAATDGGAAGGS